MRCTSVASIWPSALAALIMALRMIWAVASASCVLGLGLGRRQARHLEAGHDCATGGTLGLSLPGTLKGLEGYTGQHGQGTSTQRTLDGVAAAAQESAQDGADATGLAGILCRVAQTPLDCTHDLAQDVAQAAHAPARAPRSRLGVGCAALGSAAEGTHPATHQVFQGAAHPLLSGRGHRVLHQAADQVAEVRHRRAPIVVWVCLMRCTALGAQLSTAV